MSSQETNNDSEMVYRSKQAYCTQNNGDCSTCSLVNYGRDCKNNPIINLEPEIKQLSFSRFSFEICRARSMTMVNPESANYWVGYQNGLRKAFHGKAFGTLEEHNIRLRVVFNIDDTLKQYGQGYRDGLRGRPDEAMVDD